MSQSKVSYMAHYKFGHYDNRMHTRKIWLFEKYVHHPYTASQNISGIWLPSSIVDLFPFKSLLLIVYTSNPFHIYLCFKG